MDWRKHFREACKNNRWEFTELCRRADLNHGTFTNWMRDKGDRGEMPISAAIAVADIMGLSLDQVFLGKVPDPEQTRVLLDALAQLRSMQRDDSQSTSIDTK